MCSDSAKKMFCTKSNVQVPKMSIITTTSGLKSIRKSGRRRKSHCYCFHFCDGNKTWIVRFVHFDKVCVGMSCIYTCVRVASTKRKKTILCARCPLKSISNLHSQTQSWTLTTKKNTLFHFLVPLPPLTRSAGAQDNKGDLYRVITKNIKRIDVF